MEQTRKNLKTSSIIVLALAGLSLLNTSMFILAVSLLILLPHLYIGIKGLKIAKKPDSSKGHIVWGIILIVFTCIGLISPLLALLQGNGEAFGNASELCSIAVDVYVLIEYVKYAKAVRNGI